MFACPYCGALYPRKPVLIGRAVRCTTCKNAFCLRADGLVDKVGDQSSPAAGPAGAAAPMPPAFAPDDRTVSDRQPVTRAPARKAASSAARTHLIPLEIPPALTEGHGRTSPQPPSTDAFALVDGIEVDDLPISMASTAPVPAAKVPENTQTLRSRSSRLTTRQEQTQRVMAATLTTSMTEALKAETLKQEHQKEQRQANRAGDAAGRVGKIGPAILSGQGRTAARLQLYWWLGAAVALMLFGSCSWLVLHRSPERQALARYTAFVPGKRGQDERIQAIQERAWLVALPPTFMGVAAMDDMSDASLQAMRTYHLTEIEPLIAELNGLTLSEKFQLWLPTEQLAAIETQLQGRTQTEAETIADLTSQSIHVVSHHEWLAKVQATALGEDGAAIVDLMLRGHTNRTGARELAKLLRSGARLPIVEIVPFFGRHGMLLIRRSESYARRPVAYEGRLMHLRGVGWPDQWKVLTIDAHMQER